MYMIDSINVIFGKSDGVLTGEEIRSGNMSPIIGSADFQLRVSTLREAIAP